MNAPQDFSVRALDHDDMDLNTSGNPNFMTVLDARLSRRSLMRGGAGRV